MVPTNSHLPSFSKKMEGLVSGGAGVAPTPTRLSDLIIPPRQNFAPWKLNKKTFELEIKGGFYSVPLTELHNSAQILDWIMQLNHKNWVTPQIMKQLLNALKHYLDPQANYCSWEKNLTVDDPESLIKERRLKWE